MDPHSLFNSTRVLFSSSKVSETILAVQGVEEISQNGKANVEQEGVTDHKVTKQTTSLTTYRLTIPYLPIHYTKVDRGPEWLRKFFFSVRRVSISAGRDLL